MAGNGGIIGPPNTVSTVYKDKITVITATGCFTKSSCNPAAPGNATVVVASGGGGGGWWTDPTVGNAPWGFQGGDGGSGIILIAYPK